jgi:hypothetical protein
LLHGRNSHHFSQPAAVNLPGFEASIA